MADTRKATWVKPAVTAALAGEHGLTEDEYRALCGELGRTPSYTELGMVAAMWSEHCSYKSSRAHLAGLPTAGERVIEGPGENAGVVDIGDNQAVVFKMESHNHPSFIEPYQGAATGVGGICRDVFTMGARPIALADCLRFGRPENPRTRYLVSGVVSGIGGYGNSFGVPTVAGDVAFDDSYDGNILVNAFCLGLAPADRIVRSAAAGPGNPVIYLGAKTGRDGIHGATMASAGFASDDEHSASKRPTVQVGDPFMEKLLLEACLELMEGECRDCLVGVQDMGAAGLTSAAVEMAARAGSGIELDLERVPQREAGMTPYELMLSESQERMLMVVKQGREREVFAVFARWDLDAAVIGRVTDSGRVCARMNGCTHADMPVAFLADGPSYRRPSERPGYLREVAAVPLPPDIADMTTLSSAWLAVLGAPTVASKAWVYGQYDHMVGHSTVVRPGAADAGVVRVLAPGESAGGLGRQKGIAISAGCNSRQVYLAPRLGTALAVAENYANLVAVGAQPLAVTNCLNFGDPEKPEIMWQLEQSIAGLAEACRDLKTPVVSGNVSLNNETDGEAIKPTPMVAMVGLLDDVEQHLLMGFQKVGDTVAVLGQLAGSLAGSEYLAVVHGVVAGVPAAFVAREHKPVFDAVLAMHREGLLRSAHDLSDGGLAVAVAECALAARVPVNVELDFADWRGRTDELLFGEAPARFVVSLAPAAVPAARALAEERGAPFEVIGQTAEARAGAAHTRLSMALGDRRCDMPLADAKRVYETGFAAVLERTGE